MIEGVVTRKLTVHLDERGRLFEALRSDSEEFSQFGQAYITTAFPGVVKAWHLHKKQNDNMCLVCGEVKFVLYDSRADSATKGELMELFLSAENRMLIHIPAGVYHGFKNIGGSEAYILNVPDQLYDYDDPDEYRLPPDTDLIPYDWTRKDG